MGRNKQYAFANDFVVGFIPNSPQLRHLYVYTVKTCQLYYINKITLCPLW